VSAGSPLTRRSSAAGPFPAGFASDRLTHRPAVRRYDFDMRLAPAADPATAFIDSASWLLRPGSVVTGLQRLDEHTVRMMVADPFVLDPADRDDADQLVADSALVVLEQAAHGVRLIPTTSHRYEGRLHELTPGELTFLTGLPGVQRHDVVPEDLDNDGLVAPDEVAHHVEVDTSRDAERLDWLLRDRFDEGSLEHGPVKVLVPAQPWTIAPVSGA
jgi:hypothetical protein